MLKFNDMEQKQLVYRIISRTEELHRHLRNREARRSSKNYDVLLEIIKVFKTTKPEQLEYNLSRKALRGIQEQLTAVLHTLTTSTIPTYQSRIDRISAAQDLSEDEKHRQIGQNRAYLTANTERVRIINSMLRKVEEAL